MKFGIAKYWLFFLGGYKQTNSKKNIPTKGFINIQFLQKLNPQKPFCNEARLVNKRFGSHTLILGADVQQRNGHAYPPKVNILLVLTLL